MPSHAQRTPDTAVFSPLDSCFTGQTLIEASAGTGKTWTLTALYARLLLEHQYSVNQILVVTYTQAATAELRERIRAQLAQLLALYESDAQSDQPDESDFYRQLQRRFPTPEARRRLLLAVHGFDEASIFTIHGFCQRALQEAAFEAGSDFDNALTPDDSELLDAVITDLWRRELALADPCWAHFLANQGITPHRIRQKLRPYLGKPYLQVEPSPEEKAPLATPLESAWKKAAQGWQHEGASWIALLCAHPGLNQQTHKTAKIRLWGQMLDRYFADPALLFQIPEALGRLGAQALKKATKKGHASPEHPLAEDLDQLATQLKQQEPLYQQAVAALYARLLQNINTELPKRKTAQRLQAFDDLLNQLHQALSGENGAQLAQLLRDQYPLALIDEFQDTDPIQYAIFQRIYAEQSSANLCFVGDPKQAIYAFRGADLDTYLTARASTARHYNLTTNYRSTPALLQALNRLFQRPLPFAEERLEYHPVQAPEQTRPHLQLPAEENDTALTWVWLGDQALTKGQAEGLAAQDTARRIARLLSCPDAGFVQEDQSRIPLKGGDVAVLVANHRQAALIAEALSARSVPSVRKGRDSVWHSEEAHELAAVLTAYADPSHEGWLRYALATRLLGRDAQWLAEAQKHQERWDQERETAERYQSLWQQQGFLRAFRRWLDEEGIAKRLLERPDGERRLTNLLHLGELLEAQQERRPGMEPLLRWFAEQRSGEGGGDDALLRLESDAERVQIVTIHTSKGLEYPLVFCPFLWDGRLLGLHQDSARCHTQAGQSLLDLGGPQLETHLDQARHERFAEQLRLVYVALTRAKERLWVHWGPVQISNEQKQPKEGLHTSALAWLIHGRTLHQAPVLDQLAQHLQPLTEPEIYNALQALTQTAQGSMAIQALDEQEAVAEALPRPHTVLHLSQLGRTLQSAWRIGSFSGLTAGVHKEAPDYDASNIREVTEQGEGIHAFPRGARAGTCLHAILEDWARDKGTLETLTQAGLNAHGLPESLTPLLSQHLQHVLDTALGDHNLRLSALTAPQKRPELGFTFPVSALEVAPLRALLTDPAMGLPEPLRQAASHLKFETLHGFLKGFIDLTFEYQGLWYIVDYKSNWLGPDSSFYHEEQLLHALASEHYYLQYLIYLVALRRFLRVRLQTNDAQSIPIGGAYYLFLRGMPEAGVYFTRPSDALLDALDRLFEKRS